MCITGSWYSFLLFNTAVRLRHQCLYNGHVVNKSYKVQFICDGKCTTSPTPQAETSGGRWQYYKFGMSQMHCSKVGDEPMNQNCWAFQDGWSIFDLIQVDLIQMDDYPADNCAISPTAFLL